MKRIFIIMPIFLFAMAGTVSGSETAGSGDMQVKGLFQGWYSYDQKANDMDGFAVRRAEIEFSGNPHPHAGWFVVLDPAKPFNLHTSAQGGSRITGQVDPKTMILKNVGIVLSGWDRFPGLSFQIGQFEPPFGMEGTASSRELETIERAAQSEVLGWSDYYDVGVMAELRRGFWTAYLGIFNGEGPNSSEANRDKDVAARVVFEAAPGIHFGVAGYHGHGTADRILNEHWGLEASWARMPWSVKAEYAAGHGATSETVSPGKQTVYTQAGYYFNPKFQGVVRFDWWEPDTGVGGNIQTETRVGLNYLIDGHKFKVQADYSLHNQEGSVRSYSIARTALQVGF
ncbi:MAG: porin [bacterium]